MAIDALQVWKDTLAALPKVADPSWALNFAGWVADRVPNITPDPSILDASAGFTFVFAEPIFAAALVALPPSPSAILGVTGFALAWETAILTNIFPATLNVAAGAKRNGSSAPADTFSVVTSVLLDPVSIVAAKAKIIELAAAAPVSDPQDSEFPIKFREAFLLLKINVIGLDSTPTPAGPLPLVVMGAPLI